MADMALLRFPAELFQEVLSEAFDAVGSSKIHVLRLVCKTWDDQVTLTLYKTPISKIDGLARNLSVEQITEYIYKRVQADKLSGSFQVTIHQAADFLVEYGGRPKTEDERQKYLYQLCQVAVGYKGRKTVNFLKIPRNGECSEELRNLMGFTTNTNTILAAAAYFGSIHHVGDLHRRNFATNIYLGSPLHCAIKKGNLDDIRELLDRGANPNRADILDNAAGQGRKDILELLFEDRYGLTKSGQYYEEAVLSAIRNGHKDVALFLNESRCPGKKFEDIQLDHLSEAIKYGRMEMISIFLKGGSSPKVQQSDILVTAAKYGFPDIIQLLWKHGVDPLYKSGKFSVSAWAMAASKGYREALIQLLKLSEQKDLAWAEALYGAAGGDQTDTLAFLNKQNMIANNMDAAYRALVNAVQNNAESAVRALVGYGVDPAACAHDTTANPVLAGILAGHENMISLLFSLGAPALSEDVALKALCEAARRSSHDDVGRLINNGANINGYCYELDTTPWLEAVKADEGRSISRRESFAEFMVSQGAFRMSRRAARSRARHGIR